MIAAVATARCCAELTHARMKLDPQLFLACQYIGTTTMNGRPVLMLRNCPRCGGTLALPMAKVVELYPDIEAAL